MAHAMVDGGLPQPHTILATRPAGSSCFSVLRPNLPASRAIIVVVIDLPVVRCVLR